MSSIASGLSSTHITLNESAAKEHVSMTGDATWGLYSNAGTPESVVTANPGSICSDTTNGVVYRKITGVGNTGWDSLSTTVAFSAKKLVAAANVTGNGTNYTIQGYSEDYDLGNNFNVTTGMFTAPISGFYIFNIVLNYTGILGTHTLSNARFDFNPTPPADPLIFAVNAAQTGQSNGNLVINGNVIAQLSAAATLQIDTAFTGGAQVVNVAVIEFSGIKLS